MPIYANITEDQKIEIANHYLQEGVNLKTTAEAFGISYHTVQKYMLLVSDKKLKEKVKAKLSSHGKCTAKLSIWDEIPNKHMTRSQIIDWYVKNNGADSMTVKQLLTKAQEMGVKIVG